MTAADYFEDLCNSITLNSIPDLLDVICDIQESQVSLETVLGFRNNQRQTVLHLASAKLEDEIVQILLCNGADPSLVDSGGRSPVLELLESLRACQCESCVRKAVRCIRYLGQHGADMNISDKSGQTPLHLSALVGREDVTLELMTQGASLISETSKQSHMKVLLEYLPDIILPIFDRAIFLDLKKRHSPDFELSFDMSVILPTPNCCTQDVESFPIRMLSFLSQLFKCGSGDDSKYPTPEMGFLRQILHSSSVRDLHTYRAILQHPIVHVFTDIKWNRLKIMYFAYLAFQINLLVWYIIFILLVILIDCPANPESNPNVIKGNNSEETSIPRTQPCEIQVYTKVIAFFVLLCTLVSICKELYHFTADFRSYVVDLFNYIQWVGIGTMATTAIIALAPFNLFHVWLFPLASFGVGICWFQLFLHLGEMPTLTIYVEMFSKITVNFCISLIMYSPLIIAFVMSYCLLFPSETKLIDVPVATLRIMTMMIGELNFETLFAPTQWVRSPIMAHVWYSIFLVVIAMILMNLLVGLAVNDIGGCREHSELVVMERKIRYLTYLEKSFYLGTFFTPRCLKSYLRNRANVVILMNKRVAPYKNENPEKKYAVQIYPNKMHDSTFHAATIVAIRKWLLKQMSGGVNLETICQRHGNLEQFKIPRRPHHRLEADSESKDPQHGSSLSAKSTNYKKAQDEAKRLFKMENSLMRLETRLLDLTAKLDDVLGLVSESYHNESKA